LRIARNNFRGLSQCKCFSPDTCNYFDLVADVFVWAEFKKRNHDVQERKAWIKSLIGRYSLYVRFEIQSCF
jgi:hypothetical protein